MARRKTKGGGERFVKLPHYLLAHPSWVEMTPQARLALVEIKRRYNGYNNGQISLSCREAGLAIGCGKDRAQRALYELEYYGHIICRREGTFGNRLASEYILTHERYNNQPPTHDWKDSRPHFKKIARLPLKDLKSTLRDRKRYMEQQIVDSQ
jgi:hypothetical protein